jgi:hypothetical protein
MVGVLLINLHKKTFLFLFETDPAKRVIISNVVDMWCKTIENLECAVSGGPGLTQLPRGGKGPKDPKEATSLHLSKLGTECLRITPPPLLSSPDTAGSNRKLPSSLFLDMKSHPFIAESMRIPLSCRIAGPPTSLLSSTVVGRL